jgi:hypothetical protein
MVSYPSYLSEENKVLDWGWPLRTGRLLNQEMGIIIFNIIPKGEINEIDNW